MRVMYMAVHGRNTVSAPENGRCERGGLRRGSLPVADVCVHLHEHAELVVAGQLSCQVPSLCGTYRAEATSTTLES